MIIGVYDGAGGTSDVIVISQIRSRRYTSLLLNHSCLLSKHVLGTYTFNNVSKHVLKIRMCLLRTQWHGCQIYKLRVKLGLDIGSSWSVWSYQNVPCTMSDYLGATSRNIKSTRYTAVQMKLIGKLLMNILSDSICMHMYMIIDLVSQISELMNSSFS